MITDPISDLIIRIKNASAAGKSSVCVNYSKFAENVAQVLKKAGYLSRVEKKKSGSLVDGLELDLIYFDKEPRVHGAERISKSSRRIYQKAGDIRMFKSGFGNTFFSTPKGVLPDTEAKKLKVGGEVLFRIW
jgi:small subunit ribosomal protein S8